MDQDSSAFSLQLRGHEGRVLAVAFVPCPQTGAHDRAALSGAADGTLRLWDLCNGAEMRRLAYADPPDPAAADVAISPDGRLALTGLWTGEISLWDYASGQEIRRLQGHTEMVFGGVHFVAGRAPRGVGRGRYLCRRPGQHACACGTWTPARSCAALRGTPTRSGTPT